MNRRTLELALRRESLQLQIASQRMRLREDVAIIRGELQPIDRGLSVIRRIRLSPGLLASGAALLLGLGPKRALGSVGRAFLVVNSLRRVWQVVQSLRGHADDAEEGANAKPRVRRTRSKSEGVASDVVTKVLPETVAAGSVEKRKEL